MAGYEIKYDDLIALGRAENVKTKYSYAKDEKKELLNRMEKYKQNHLFFMYDFSVLFNDNMSERDLKKPRTARRWLVDSAKPTDMKCTAVY